MKHYAAWCILIPRDGKIKSPRNLSQQSSAPRSRLQARSKYSIRTEIEKIIYSGAFEGSDRKMPAENSWDGNICWKIISKFVAIFPLISSDIAMVNRVGLIEILCFLTFPIYLNWLFDRLNETSRSLIDAVFPTVFYFG